MKTALANPRVDRMFRAFSDLTRLRILELLRMNGELCVGDLVEILQVPQPTASRHLAYLRRTGFVLGRKEGMCSFYCLAPSRSSLHAKLIESLGACTRDGSEFAADRALARKIRLTGGCCPK